MSEALSRQERIFVAGADTLIGAGIITAFRREGYDVIDGIGEVDLRNAASVSSFFERHRPKAVVLAADNLVLVTHVIHEAWRHGTVRLMYLASSCSDPKLAGMQMCEAYRLQYGVQFFAGIPADAFGPGDDFSPEDSHVVAGLMRRMHEAKLAGAEAIDIWGSGNQRREFIFVPDLGNACVFALQHYTGAGPINLGGGRDTAIGELARLIREVVGFTGTLRFDTSKPDGMPFKALDSSELRALGWQPATDFHTALKRTYEWFLAKHASAVTGAPA